MTYEFVPQFSKMLRNLSGLLDKAQAHAEQKKFDVANLLNARLIADQFSFLRQVQITCDTAKGYAAKLSGQQPPKHEDNETTLPQLKERIQKTIAYLETVRADQFKGWESQKILNPRKEGKYLPGNEFAMEHAIPNFYFHITTAYSILRHNGVDVGKKDYLGEIRYRDL
jgi:uncharacterized protein